MENSKNLWEKLRKVLLSNNKLKFLNNITSIELNLFEKVKEKINDLEGGYSIRINYKSINKNFEDQIENFKSIQLLKPLDDINSENDSELAHFYFEKVDNTGNVQLWPCEEIMAIYCLLNKNSLMNKKIIELGSGFSGLCGLLIAKNINNITEVCITDGNSLCVEAVKRNIELNFPNEDKRITDKIILWDRNYTIYDISDKNKFDVVLISDCLFFKNYHVDLVSTIDYLLTQDGLCFIVAPSRGDSMERFLEIAEQIFEIKKTTDEISFWNKYASFTCDEDKYNFQPFLIQLRKKAKDL
jgi:calmodulin-lysine N-methyltransferase